MLYSEALYEWELYVHTCICQWWGEQLYCNSLKLTDLFLMNSTQGRVTIVKSTCNECIIVVCLASIGRQSSTLNMSLREIKDNLTIEFTCLSIRMFESNTTLRLHKHTELRTQTFIYLTNNVHNYIQIVKKYLINQVRRLPLRQKVCRKHSSHPWKAVIKSNYNVACQPYCGV